MNRNKYYIIGAITVIAIVIVLYIYTKIPNLAMKKFAGGSPVAVDQKIDANINATNSQPAHFCPAPETLIKEGTKWTTPDHKWENYNPSMATKVLNFIGAQWVGIKVGKVICLYQTNEAVAFPVALEQTRSSAVLEPKNTSWSALVEGNRRFCKSANTVDCPYFFEAPKDISNIYEEIKYAPNKDANI